MIVSLVSWFPFHFGPHSSWNDICQKLIEMRIQEIRIKVFFHIRKKIKTQSSVMLDNLTDRITESKVSDLWNVIHQSKVQT